MALTKITSNQISGVTGSTGTGALVLATLPTLVTPVLGVATATSINKVNITAPSTSATLTLVNGSSLITAGAYAITLTATATTDVTLPTTGTLATLAGTEELSNKTLASSVGKGTWTASGTWTLPALTLGGIVSGGGNQINDVIIGAVTPLAGTFTNALATSLLGYTTGSGGTVTQETSRTTGVTLNKTSGAITLVSAVGTATWQSFTVTNSTVAATDTIIINQKSGTDLNMVHITNVAAGSFQVTFATTGGTTTEQPIFNFAVIKAVTS